MIKSYKISVPQNTLNKIYSKVKSYPWNLIQNISGWEYGTNFNYLKSILFLSNDPLAIDVLVSQFSLCSV